MALAIVEHSLFSTGPSREWHRMADTFLAAGNVLPPVQARIPCYGQCKTPSDKHKTGEPVGFYYLSNIAGSVAC